MLRADDIQSLTEFLRNHKKHIQKLKKSGRPAVLTINGRAEVVIQDAASYQAMVDAVDRMEAIEGLRRGLASMRAGKGKPAAVVIKELRKKFRVPRNSASTRN
ncbi:MAG: type II toxin-antitoxin system Phd/YefM family antitoxin [Planctomycetes bacterium]|nr:type II toxin-antitoxin system Phd/YefM family antitoxin [Planctomycetota bacterium]